MKISTLIFVLLCLIVSGHAQNTPPVFLINNDSTTYFELDSTHWKILADKNEDLTIQQVMGSKLNKKFQANQSHILDYSTNVFWLHYRVKNNLEKKITICLLNNNDADRSDFYYSKVSSEWEHVVTGRLLPLKQMNGLKELNAIPVTLDPGQEIEVYNRIKNDYYVNKPKSLGVQLGSYHKILEEDYFIKDKNYSIKILDHLFDGIYFFGIFLYLFFFLTTRERLYLYYSLFLVYLLSYGDFITHVIFPNHLQLYNYGLDLINCAGVIIYIQFLRAFFHTHVSSPRWDYILYIFNWTIAIVYVLTFFIEPHLPVHWNDTKYFIRVFFIELGLSFMVVTFLLYRDANVKDYFLLVISGLPVIVFEIVGDGVLYYYNYRMLRTGMEYPQQIIRFGDISNTINNFLMAWLAIVFSLILFRRFLRLQKANANHQIEKIKLEQEKEAEKNKLVEQQKVDLQKAVDDRTAELRTSLVNLKSTQSQLIQSEKMASLGELTAGIAHEIQNPLNFVNNFSEVNKELADELVEEMVKGNYSEAKLLAKNIKENEEKINHHGRRADAIVKGMLQHSRSNSGVKEPTDINALCDEYLRLSYHGLRAKDKSFNAKFVTDFDQSLSKINVVPQDIGRVVLNLINNAFYAVTEKSKQQPNNYEPTVTITTKKSGDHVLISVKDNGDGIPDSIKEKIFQPFFTTKPTGQGTGLGLSLSYDIVKAHGGEIKVATDENEGTEFIIQLPV